MTRTSWWLKLAIRFQLSLTLPVKSNAANALCGINAVAVVNTQLLRRFLQERPAVSRAQESISGFTLGMV